MSEQVVLTILIVTVAFRAEAELQTRIVQFRPSAHRAPMLRPARIVHMLS